MINKCCELVKLCHINCRELETVCNEWQLHAGTWQDQLLQVLALETCVTCIGLKAVHHIVFYDEHNFPRLDTILLRPQTRSQVRHC